MIEYCLLGGSAPLVVAQIVASRQLHCSQNCILSPRKTLGQGSILQKTLFQRVLEQRGIMREVDAYPAPMRMLSYALTDFV